MGTHGGGTYDTDEPSAAELGRGRRLLWLVVLVLAALGGAGLATAADRPPTDEARPELTWRAEQAAQARLEAMTAWLERLDEEVGALSAAGRGALIGLAGQDEGRLSAAIADGEAVADRIAVLAEGLRIQRAEQRAIVDDVRLGNASRQRLASIDAAVSQAGALPDTWVELAEAARAGDAVTVTDRLVAIETARGAINRALGREP